MDAHVQGLRVDVVNSLETEQLTGSLYSRRMAYNLSDVTGGAVERNGVLGPWNVAGHVPQRKAGAYHGGSLLRTGTRYQSCGKGRRSVRTATMEYSYSTTRVVIPEL